MKEELKKYADTTHCPIRNIISRFSTKWGLLLLTMLGECRYLRFGEMERALPDISPKVLSSTLKQLEADGLISRRAYPDVPPRVEYSITSEGDSLLPIIAELTQWAVARMEKRKSAHNPV